LTFSVIVAFSGFITANPSIFDPLKMIFSFQHPFDDGQLMLKRECLSYLFHPMHLEARPSNQSFVDIYPVIIKLFQERYLFRNYGKLPP
jgi:hypothetical protein